MTRMIRVVVADDSPFVCRLLSAYLESTADFEVVGMATNGLQAITLIESLHPDVVTLDQKMPELDGLKVLEHIMRRQPTPVIMVSGISRKGAAVTLEALKLGAVDFILKYTPGKDTNPDILRREIIDKVRAASRVKVIRLLQSQPLQQLNAAVAHPFDQIVPVPRAPKDVVVIGASTGGPGALRELLSALPAHFPAAILIVQHIPPSFTKVLAAQLDRHVALNVREAHAGDYLVAGQVLVAPGDYHLLVRSDGQIELSKGPEVNGHRPAIDVTMQSVAEIYGQRASGVVLTGMGDDGVAGLATIRAKGGQTFAQDAVSCVINGMPQQAINMRVVDYIASPAAIGRLLTVNFGRRL